MWCHAFAVWNMSSCAPSGYSNLQSFVHCVHPRSYKSLSLDPACTACCPPQELIRQWNCAQDLSKSPVEPESDFLLIQALELKQHGQSKLGKSAFYPSEQYLNFPMLPLLFSLVFFFLESELFVQTDFPSVYLLVFLITVIWGGGRWARGRNQGKTMVNWALFNTPTEKKEWTSNYCKNYYSIKTVTRRNRNISWLCH